MTELERLEKEIAELAQQSLGARSQIEEHEAALADLDAERSERADRLALVERQALEYGSALAQKQDELAEARREEVRRRLDGAVERRDAASSDAVGAVEEVLHAFKQLERSREELMQIRADAASAGVVSELSPESEQLSEAVERLSEGVRAFIGGRHDDELVDAAARSRDADAIKALPEHLREAARQRRRRVRQRFPGH